jgi:hypothetical protein
VHPCESGRACDDSDIVSSDVGIKEAAIILWINTPAFCLFPKTHPLGTVTNNVAMIEGRKKENSRRVNSSASSQVQLRVAAEAEPVRVVLSIECRGRRFPQILHGLLRFVRTVCRRLGAESLPVVEHTSRGNVEFPIAALNLLNTSLSGFRERLTSPGNTSISRVQ